MEKDYLYSIMDFLTDYINKEKIKITLSKTTSLANFVEKYGIYNLDRFFTKHIDDNEKGVDCTFFTLVPENGPKVHGIVARTIQDAVNTKEAIHSGKYEVSLMSVYRNSKIESSWLIHRTINYIDKTTINLLHASRLYTLIINDLLQTDDDTERLQKYKQNSTEIKNVYYSRITLLSKEERWNLDRSLKIWYQNYKLKDNSSLLYFIEGELYIITNGRNGENSILSEENYCGIKTIQRIDRQWGITDFEGNEIVPFGIYCWMDSFSQNLCIVSKDIEIDGNSQHKYGIINKMGKVVLPFEFDYIDSFDYSALKTIAKNYIEDFEQEYEISLKKFNKDGYLCVKEIDMEAKSKAEYDAECERRRNRELREDTWYAMTDGMYGDYPDDLDD